jgi:hypothetical protein
MDLQTTLRYLGIPIRDVSYMHVWRQWISCQQLHSATLQVA